VTATDATGRRLRARRGEGGQLRDELVAAAERLLATTGDEEAVSIRAIADAVGVSPPAIYLHFPDKDALIFEVCAARFAELDQAIEEAAAGIDDPIDALVARGKAYVRFGVEHPEQYRVLFLRRGTGRKLDADELRTTAAFGNLLGAVERAQREGKLSLGAGADAIEIGMELWAVAHGVTSLLIGVHDFPWPDDFVDRVLTTYVRGLTRAAVTSS
jgi:AcrR family transcriptional regulator